MESELVTKAINARYAAFRAEQAAQRKRDEAVQAYVALTEQGTDAERAEYEQQVRLMDQRYGENA